MQNKVFYSSPYIPAEWIKIHGFQPVNMVSQKHISSQGISEGICSYAELMLQQAEQFDGAAVLFTTRCDQMRRISELFDSIKTKLFLMNIPSTWQSSTAIEIYKDELKRLSSFLVKTGGNKPDFNKLTKLYKNKKPPSFPNLKGKRLALMGGPAVDDDSELIEIIKKNSANICLNVTETGELSIPKINLKNLAKDPFLELTTAYFANMSDIAKRPNYQFYEQVEKILNDRKIEAIIVKTYPWCDLWHAEIPRIKEFFKLPVLNFTVDVCSSPKNDSRLKTRLKAFFEML